MFSLRVCVRAYFALQVHLLNFIICQCCSESLLVSDEFIHQINLIQSNWKAGRNFRASICDDTLTYLVGGRTDPDTNMQNRFFLEAFLIVKNWNDIIDEFEKDCAMLILPDLFDAREHWPNCKPVISIVMDTGLCASSWAVSTTQAIRDRYCIRHNAQVDKTFSAKQLLDCCPYCNAKNCQNGNPISAYEYFYRSGLPSGGYYNSSLGCKPYDIPPSEQCLMALAPDPNCTRGAESTCTVSCTSRVDDRPFEPNRYKIAEYYHLAPEILKLWDNDKVLKAEIYLRGSVTAEVTVYDDFLNYKQGVYYPTSIAKYFGVLTVRLIGWGSESGMNYWLAANVWGPNWGDSGFVKFKLWDEKLNIEKRVTVGRVRTV